MKHSLILVTLITVATCALFGAEWITIYNDDLSLIRSQFELELQEGRQDYNFADITARIDAPSVIVSSPNNQLRVAEQNYEYDLAGKSQIMAKYLDQEVVLLSKEQATRYTGILKFYDGNSLGIIESGTGKLQIVRESELEVIQLASLPSNFYTKPTLRWSLIAPRTGRFPVEMSYLSGGFSWDVAYNAVWNGEELALGSWVTIRNYSGKAFENVHLKLVAGEINRAWNKGLYGAMEDMAMGRTETVMAPSFEERAFHDFHLYELDQEVSFGNNQTKQLELYPLQNIQARGEYLYNVHSDGVLSNIVFVNNEASGLGKPLPKGIFKIYKKDLDGNLEFIGEDSIDHTSRNEEITLTTGKAFDLVGSTVVKETRVISQRVSDRTIQVTLRNNSAEVKTIKVARQLNSTTRILESSQPFAVDNDLLATTEVTINPNEEKIITFKERNEY